MKVPLLISPRAAASYDFVQSGGKVAPASSQSGQAQGVQNPPVQQGYVRIKSSKGGVHDIPQNQLDAAKKIDPQLEVQSQ